jgi:adenylate cyclase
MNARLERKLRLLTTIVIAGGIAGMAFNATHDQSVLPGLVTGMLISVILGSLEFVVAEGAVRRWLNTRSFTASILIKSAIYAIVILGLQWFPVAETLTGQVVDPAGKTFLSSLVYSVAVSIVFNLVLALSNLIGMRVLVNFFTGRYHHPVEENRFVLFVDIAGSTGLAEKLGGIGIHRLLDRTFRLLTLAVVDCRGEVLGYVGDEVIVTWSEKHGAVDCRPLRCFAAMREELSRAAVEFEREFGAAPKIRGSLHFGPVIIGEIGDVKRAIVFNGDVMNTAARLEALSRDVDGGFVASRAAMDRFKAALPFAMQELGRLPIRGRLDGIDAMGLKA